MFRLQDVMSQRVRFCPAPFWPGGPGLHDPCEKELTDTLSAMTEEEAESITYSAQVGPLACHS